MAYSQISRNAKTMTDMVEIMSNMVAAVMVTSRTNLATAQALTTNTSTCRVQMRFSDNFSTGEIHSPDFSMMIMMISSEVDLPKWDKWDRASIE